MRKSAHSFQLRNDSSERKRDNDNDETPINSRIFYSICLSLSGVLLVPSLGYNFFFSFAAVWSIFVAECAREKYCCVKLTRTV